MAVSSNDFLALSEQLLAMSNSEIAYRNVISRLYYCLIHSVAAELSADAPTQYHTKMERYLKDSARHSEKEIIASEELVCLGHMLAARRAKRVIADYKLTETVTEEDAEGEMVITQDILSYLHSDELDESD